MFFKELSLDAWWAADCVWAFILVITSGVSCLPLSVSRETDSYVAFMDIDGFKHVNDDYGHLLGDKVLKMLGEVLNKLKPKLTTVGRLGGDEFIILFDEIASSVVLTELEQVIHNYIYGLYELGVDVKGTGSGLSIGVVRIESGMTMKGILSVADEAMYEAKRSGKNKVVYYG